MLNQSSSVIGGKKLTVLSISISVPPPKKTEELEITMAFRMNSGQREKSRESSKRVGSAGSGLLGGKGEIIASGRDVENHRIVSHFPQKTKIPPWDRFSSKLSKNSTSHHAWLKENWGLHPQKLSLGSFNDPVGGHPPIQAVERSG